MSFDDEKDPNKIIPPTKRPEMPEEIRARVQWLKEKKEYDEYVAKQEAEQARLAALQQEKERIAQEKRDKILAKKQEQKEAKLKKINAKKEAKRLKQEKIFKENEKLSNLFLQRENIAPTVAERTHAPSSQKEAEEIIDSSTITEIELTNQEKINQTIQTKLTNSNAKAKTKRHELPEFIEKENPFDDSSFEDVDVSTPVKRTPFQSFLFILSDVITIPVLAISLFTAITMYSAKQAGYVPTLFGKSVVTVVSGSMRSDTITIKNDEGEPQIVTGPSFEIGDTVMVQSCDPTKLSPGDIIAFYEYVDPDEKQPITFTESTTEINTTLSPAAIGGKSDPKSALSKAAEAKSRVIFHYVIEVNRDERGFWFKTQGSSNNSADRNYVYQDFVIGKYSEGSDSSFVRETLAFMSSKIGIIVFAIIPCGISLIVDTLTLVEQLDLLIMERKFEKAKFFFEGKNEEF